MKPGARLEMFFWWFSVISIRFVGSFVSFLIKRHPSIIDFFDFHGVAISRNEYISFSTWMLYIYFALYRVAVQHPPSTSFSYYYSFKRINHCASFWKHFVQSSMNVTMRIVGMNSTFIAIQFEIKLSVYCHRNKCSRFFCVEFQFWNKWCFILKHHVATLRILHFEESRIDKLTNQKRNDDFISISLYKRSARNWNAFNILRFYRKFPIFLWVIFMRHSFMRENQIRAVFSTI